jgi:hypothetical protein
VQDIDLFSIVLAPLDICSGSARNVNASQAVNQHVICRSELFAVLVQKYLACPF